MQFLHKFLFFNPDATKERKEIYLTSGAINFMTWFQKDASQGTMIHSRAGDGFLIEGVPDVTNNGAFNGLFLKCTAWTANGDNRKYTAWINPQNIFSVYQAQPDSTEIHFRDGQVIVIANKLPDLMRALIEHNRKYTERKKESYGRRD